MNIACLDLEGVIFPEIWINVAEKTGIKELRLTTRDISDYNELMQHRLKILSKHKITINLIQDVISKIKPLEGAKDFFDKLKEKYQVVILSDTFYQFAMPLMKQLGYPTILCHNLTIDENNMIINYNLRQNDAKKEAVLAFHNLNFKTIACGDSYNDVSMLKTANKGIFFKPPQSILDEYPEFDVAYDYKTLLEKFINNL